MEVCSIKGCDRPLYAKGWCNMHYQRVATHSDAGGSGRSHAPAEERFWRRVDKTGSCWIWTGSRRPNGYGQMQAGGKGSATVSTHRFSYEMHRGPIPKGRVVMHSCDNHACVNPAHLGVGTYKANTADMIAKGRHARRAPCGQDNGKSILTETMVRMIRASSKTNADLSRELGVSPNAIRGVRTGRTWTHVA